MPQLRDEGASRKSPVIVLVHVLARAIVLAVAIAVVAIALRHPEAYRALVAAEGWPTAGYRAWIRGESGLSHLSLPISHDATPGVTGGYEERF